MRSTRRRNVCAWCVLCGLAGCIEAPRAEGALRLEAGDAGVSELGFDAGGMKPAVGHLGSGSTCAQAGSGDLALPGDSAGFDDAGSDQPVELSPSSLDAGSEGRLPSPARHGDLVITEVLPDPKTIDDTRGEWFELHNPTATAFDLSGCAVVDRSGTPHPVSETLVLEPGAYVSVARSTEVGFVPDVVLSFSLTNTAGQIALSCQGVEIDRVVFDASAKFPLAPGASSALDPAHLSAADNDLASAWCLATTSYGAELGTPGAANPACDPDAAPAP
jgi:Lamin Tail Domain